MEIKMAHFIVCKLYHKHQFTNTLVNIFSLFSPPLPIDFLTSHYFRNYISGFHFNYPYFILSLGFIIIVIPNDSIF